MNNRDSFRISVARATGRTPNTPPAGGVLYVTGAGILDPHHFFCKKVVY
jgi:hypothetical protein